METLFGRTEELKALRAYFNDGARMVSILGFGGVGKTRLATAYLAQVPDRTVFCDISMAHSTADVLSVLALAAD